MKDLACLHRAPLLTPSFTMDVSEDTDLVQQLNSTQEETATHDPVEEDHLSVNFVVGDKFSSYNDLKKKLSEFEESHCVLYKMYCTYIAKLVRLGNKVNV